MENSQIRRDIEESTLPGLALTIESPKFALKKRLPPGHLPELALVNGKVHIVFTTAVEGMPAATERIAPNAGNIFWADTSFTSLPQPPPLFPSELLL